MPLNKEQGPSPEKLLPIGKTLEIIRDTNQKYKSLVKESDQAINTQNIETYYAKSQEAAQLIIDLPKNIEPLLDGLEESTRHHILAQMQASAKTAQLLIDKKAFSGMSAILNSQGDRESDKNHLERLIDEVEKIYLSTN